VEVGLEGAITSLLAVQLLILPNPQIEDDNGNINRKALGYIYGHIDAFLITRGYDTSDSDMSVPLTFQVLRKLFPIGNPTKYMDFLIHNLTDEMVTLGCMEGGQPYLDYQKPNTGGSPMGLARFILEANTSGSKGHTDVLVVRRNHRIPYWRGVCDSAACARGLASK